MEEPKNDKRSKWYDRGWATGCVFPLLVAIVTGVPSWFLSEYHTETQNVAEIAAKFDNVDEGMKYQDAINIIAQENENLKIEVNTLQQGSDSLTSQLQNKPDVTFYSPSVIQDGLKVMDSVSKGVADINGRIYIAAEAIDPLMDGTVTFDPSQNLLSAGKSGEAEITKVDLLDTTALHDGERCMIYRPSEGKSFSVGGVPNNKGFTLDTYWNEGLALINLNYNYAKASFNVGHVDGTALGDTTLQVFLGKDIYKEYRISSDIPSTPIEIPVNYAGSMKLQLSDSESFSSTYAFTDFILTK